MTEQQSTQVRQQQQNVHKTQRYMHLPSSANGNAQCAHSLKNIFVLETSSCSQVASAQGKSMV